MKFFIIVTCFSTHSLIWSPQGSKETLSKNYATSNFDGPSFLPQSHLLYRAARHPENHKNGSDINVKSSNTFLSQTHNTLPFSRIEIWLYNGKTNYRKTDERLLLSISVAAAATSISTAPPTSSICHLICFKKSLCNRLMHENINLKYKI